MKKTGDVLGLPIISISDGNEVGKVKSMIINADSGAVDFVVVDSGIQILGASVISADKILGIGGYALTIEDKKDIGDISTIPSAIELLQKNVQVKGTRVLTKKGRLIGEIGDIYIDEDNNCRIAALEFIADGLSQVKLIPGECVITFGKNLIVVEEDVESKLVDSQSQLSPADGEEEVKKKLDITSDEDKLSYKPALADVSADESGFPGMYVDEELKNEENQDEVHDALIDSLFDRTEEDIDKVVSESLEDGDEEGSPVADERESQENNAAALFEQKQRQYLIGRKVTKTITNSQGNIIVGDGEVINGDIIDTCKENGKLVELIMNNRA